jgi:ABC-type polar amino acid transport system ATPase subunit
MNDVAIHIDSVSKSYFEKPSALKNVTLVVPQGALLSIIGRNGSGKTTLLKCVAGLLGFESGSITIAIDGDLRKLAPGTTTVDRPFRKRIAMIFQDGAIWPHMSVLDNVKRPLIDTRALSPDKAEEISHKYLVEYLGLSESHLLQEPAKLSGGLRKRVAIARTLALDDTSDGIRILLLDEIEAHLDPPGVETVLNLLERRFIHDEKRTVLMVTHRIDTLTRCASHVAVIDDGALIDAAAKEEILERPRPETAEFIEKFIAPARSEAVLGYRCLATALQITSLTLKRKGEVGALRDLAQNVSHLVEELEEDAPHLILIVAQDRNNPQRLVIRGINKSDKFILDGEAVPRLGKIVEESNRIRDGEVVRTEYGLIDDHASILQTEGVCLDSGENFGGSLIAMLFTGKKNVLKFRWAARYEEIGGVYHTKTPPDEQLARAQYYELSRGTKNVYLFPMEVENKVVGVISIDTYADEVWHPVMVKQFKLIANMGAIAMKLHDVE